MATNETSPTAPQAPKAYPDNPPDSPTPTPSPQYSPRYRVEWMGRGGSWGADVYDTDKSIQEVESYYRRAEFVNPSSPYPRVTHVFDRAGGAWVRV